MTPDPPHQNPGIFVFGALLFPRVGFSHYFAPTFLPHELLVCCPLPAVVLDPLPFFYRASAPMFFAFSCPTATPCFSFTYFSLFSMKPFPLMQFSPGGRCFFGFFLPPLFPPTAVEPEMRSFAGLLTVCFHPHSRFFPGKTLPPSFQSSRIPVWLDTPRGVGNSSSPMAAASILGSPSVFYWFFFSGCLVSPNLALCPGLVFGWSPLTPFRLPLPQIPLMAESLFFPPPFPLTFEQF